MMAREHLMSGGCRKTVDRYIGSVNRSPASNPNARQHGVCRPRSFTERLAIWRPKKISRYPPTSESKTYGLITIWFHAYEKSLNQRRLMTFAIIGFGKIAKLLLRRFPKRHRSIR